MRKTLIALFLLLAHALIEGAILRRFVMGPKGVTTIDALWRFHPGDNPA